VGTKEEDMRAAIFKVCPVPASSTPDAFFAANFVFRKLPLNWKKIVEDKYGVKPVSTALNGKPEAGIWPPLAAPPAAQ
jgi:hypothetical protein